MLKILSKQKEKSCTVGLNRVLDWTPQVTHDEQDVAGDVVVALRLDDVLVLFLLMALLVLLVLTALLLLLALAMLSELLLIMVNIVTFASPQPWDTATTSPSQKLKDGRTLNMTVELLIL